MLSGQADKVAAIVVNVILKRDFNLPTFQSGQVERVAVYL
jgi:hypothetical protein